MWSAKGPRLAGVLALLALLAAPALPGAAGGRVLAHAQLVASSPGAGGIVADSPEEIRLIFSEPLESKPVVPAVPPVSLAAGVAHGSLVACCLR